MSTNIAPKFYKISNINSVADSEKVAGAIFFDDATLTTHVYGADNTPKIYGSRIWVYSETIGSSDSLLLKNFVLNSRVGDRLYRNTNIYTDSLYYNTTSVLLSKKVTQNTSLEYNIILTFANHKGWSYIGFTATSDQSAVSYTNSEIFYNYEDYATVGIIDSKQDILESGANIKTINGYSVLGAGNITIEIANKGYFLSEAALIYSYPSANAGDTAYVMSTSEDDVYLIYQWDEDDGGWRYTGRTKTESTVDVSKFLTATAESTDEYEDTNIGYLPVSGGTVSGNLNVVDIITTGRLNVEGLSTFLNDAVFEKNISALTFSLGTGSIQGNLTIGEDITVVNIVASGNITANQFIKNGSTSEDVLLGDGTTILKTDLVPINLISVEDTSIYNDVSI